MMMGCRGDRDEVGIGIVSKYGCIGREDEVLSDLA